MKIRVTITYETYEGMNIDFDKKVEHFIEALGGEFIGSGTSFESQTPKRDLVYDLEMIEIKSLDPVLWQQYFKL